MEGIGISRAILGILFDFDGTLTKPGAVDYQFIRKVLDCPVDKPILEHILSFPVQQRLQALRELDDFEFDGAIRSVPNRNARRVINYLRKRRIPFSILSRNSKRSVLRALENIDFLNENDFLQIITRDDPLPPKPDPAAVLLAAENMSINPDQLLVGGDYVYDIEAGNRAGSPTVHLTNHRKDLNYSSDLVIDDLSELIPILEKYTPNHNYSTDPSDF
jgi:HAD superfamily hydrolase (TIGR01549 family)